MAPPLNLLIRALVAFEDVIIRQILRSPGFHRGVGRIQRFVDEKQNGPMPHEPLRQGEASGREEGFLETQDMRRDRLCDGQFKIGNIRETGGFNGDRMLL
ncbi:hypothetical protein K4K55_011987 [Colletotrichum sp. SAR 10_96]|nr:hypothetical protein K4K55_011987 [Colletotrichum sp. SAR 10_96]